MSKTISWQDKARNAFEAYLKELEQDLPEGSTINDIEKKLWESHRPFLNQILQTRLENEDFPPSKESKLR